jgi:hypothetical protein
VGERNRPKSLDSKAVPSTDGLIAKTVLATERTHRQLALLFRRINSSHFFCGAAGAVALIRHEKAMTLQTLLLTAALISGSS